MVPPHLGRKGTKSPLWVAPKEWWSPTRGGTTTVFRVLFFRCLDLSLFFLFFWQILFRPTCGSRKSKCAEFSLRSCDSLPLFFEISILFYSGFPFFCTIFMFLRPAAAARSQISRIFLRLYDIFPAISPRFFSHFKSFSFFGLAAAASGRTRPPATFPSLFLRRNRPPAAAAGRNKTKNEISPWLGLDIAARGSSGLKPLRRCAPVSSKQCPSHVWNEIISWQCAPGRSSLRLPYLQITDQPTERTETWTTHTQKRQTRQQGKRSLPNPSHCTRDTDAA